MLDLDKPAHARADGRLRAELIIWLTTVTPAGQPQSTPVWFVWDGSEFVIYGAAGAPKNRNIAANPHVSLHLEGNGQGGGIVIFEGRARIDPGGQAADADPVFVAKYGQRIAAMSWTPQTFARDYPHLIRVTPTRARVW